MGTKGELVANMSMPSDQAFCLFSFDTNETTHINADYANVGDSITGGHGGGDQGIIADLYRYLTGELDAEDVSEIGISCENHMIAFAAEDSRRNGTVVSLKEYMEKYM